MYLTSIEKSYSPASGEFDMFGKLVAKGETDTRLDTAAFHLKELLSAVKKVWALEALGLSGREYFLATVHRAENVDDKFRLKEILRGLKRISRDFSLPMVFPVHPRTRKMVKARTSFL